ncbi:mRNA-decapping enzyme 2, putative [Plasmodium relictum]|uniref:mRNA-decapping enzyme 2, putative n=1 Tax=Plasmodium relictum TaxID=85471 RepID=A0A1J1HE64_PLARL|nr:mRNA-decapping enzyme 2, putative [Plasmodium relictum]CRH02337.1 mRNA-decapping enzyme 2, putative [Plasmodium relictum]
MNSTKNTNSKLQKNSQSKFFNNIKNTKIFSAHRIKQLAKDKKLLDDALLDCYGRFIALLPEFLLKDHVHLYFQIQEAYWWYDDMWQDKYPDKLPKLSLKTFGYLICDDCPILKKYVPPSAHEQFSLNWRRYCRTIPLRGAILLNHNLKKCLLVKGWSTDSWAFPRGKVDELEEDSVCACREIYEEIGIDIFPYIDEQVYIETHIEDQPIKLFIIPGVREDTKFQPKTRKEIGDIRWFEIDKLKTYQDLKEKDNLFENKRERINAWFVFPFIPNLIKWIHILRMSVSENSLKENSYESGSILAYKYQITGIDMKVIRSLQNADYEPKEILKFSSYKSDDESIEKLSKDINIMNIDGISYINDDKHNEDNKTNVDKTTHNLENIPNNIHIKENKNNIFSNVYGIENSNNIHNSIYNNIVNNIFSNDNKNITNMNNPSNNEKEIKNICINSIIKNDSYENNYIEKNNINVFQNGSHYYSILKNTTRIDDNNKIKNLLDNKNCKGLSESMNNNFKENEKEEVKNLMEKPLIQNKKKDDHSENISLNFNYFRRNDTIENNLIYNLSLNNLNNIKSENNYVNDSINNVNNNNNKTNNCKGINSSSNDIKNYNKDIIYINNNGNNGYKNIIKDSNNYQSKESNNNIKNIDKNVNFLSNDLFYTSNKNINNNNKSYYGNNNHMYKAYNTFPKNLDIDIYEKRYRYNFNKIRMGHLSALRLKEVGLRSFDDQDIDKRKNFQIHVYGNKNKLYDNRKDLYRFKKKIKKYAGCSLDDSSIYYIPSRNTTLDACNDKTFGENHSNGWSAEDMFKLNEEKFGVQSTYNIEDYTTPLVYNEENINKFNKNGLIRNTYNLSKNMNNFSNKTINSCSNNEEKNYICSKTDNYSHSNDIDNLLYYTNNMPSKNNISNMNKANSNNKKSSNEFNSSKNDFESTNKSINECNNFIISTVMKNQHTNFINTNNKVTEDKKDNATNNINTKNDNNNNNNNKLNRINNNKSININFSTINNNNINNNYENNIYHSNNKTNSNTNNLSSYNAKENKNTSIINSNNNKFILQNNNNNNVCNSFDRKDKELEKNTSFAKKLVRYDITDSTDQKVKNKISTNSVSKNKENKDDKIKSLLKLNYQNNSYYNINSTLMKKDKIITQKNKYENKNNVTLIAENSKKLNNELYINNYQNIHNGLLISDIEKNNLKKKCAKMNETSTKKWDNFNLENENISEKKEKRDEKLEINTSGKYLLGLIKGTNKNEIAKENTLNNSNYINKNMILDKNAKCYSEKEILSKYYNTVQEISKKKNNSINNDKKNLNHNIHFIKNNYNNNNIGSNNNRKKIENNKNENDENKANECNNEGIMNNEYFNESAMLEKLSKHLNSYNPFE